MAAMLKMGNLESSVLQAAYDMVKPAGRPGDSPWS